MIQQVYSVYDTKAEFFGSPLVLQNDAIAKRVFGQSCSDRSTTLWQHPNDFKMVRIGTFNDATGQLETTEPQTIAWAYEFKTQEHPSFDLGEASNG